MSTLRGQDGLVVLGGHVIGSPFVNGAVANLDTTVNLDNNGAGTLLGVSAPGDTFVVGATTYTVTSAFLLAAGNAIAGITFTPGAVGGFSDNDPVTYNLTSVAQVRQWTLNPALAALDTTVMGDKARTFRGGLMGFSGTAEALLDNADTEQAALISEILSGTPDGTVASLLFGAQAGAPRHFYGSAVLTGFDVVSSLADLVAVTFNWQGTGVLLMQYT